MHLSWLRWTALLTLAVISLGPGMLWSSPNSKIEADFGQGWSAVPLPQQIVDAKSKLHSPGFSLLVLSLGLTPRIRQAPIHAGAPYRPAPPRGRWLYLLYARLQTDDG
ncbi:hypothetical protein [uncultured Meiothermus sp.]|jgi:hypothetical protein|uniref:hypothetical protein n=1 Tax=uncultured Meiothermus sp. TaxID=157471 RepID=UPI0026154408|nr:hypothetical protein [uncultured Meiothermus sp.]